MRIIRSAALLQKRTGLYDAVQRTISADRADLSLRSGQPGMYALVVSVRSMPGHRSEYESALKTEILPALKKVGFSNAWTGDTVFGGPSNEQVIVIPMKEVGDLDQGPPLVRALGPESAAKLEARLDALSQSSEIRIVKVRPELSNMPDLGPPPN